MVPEMVNEKLLVVPLVSFSEQLIVKVTLEPQPYVVPPQLLPLAGLDVLRVEPEVQLTV